MIPPTPRKTQLKIFSANASLQFTIGMMQGDNLNPHWLLRGVKDARASLEAAQKDLEELIETNKNENQTQIHDGRNNAAGRCCG